VTWNNACGCLMPVTPEEKIKKTNKQNERKINSKRKGKRERERLSCLNKFLLLRRPRETINEK